MEVYSSISGDRLITLDATEFVEKTVADVKKRLSTLVGVSRFRQCLFREGCAEQIEDGEVFVASMEKVVLVLLEFQPLNPMEIEELMDVIEREDLLSLKSFLVRPIDPNVIIGLEWSHGKTLLHHAVQNRRHYSVQLLLEAAADGNANLPQRGTCTPLYYAAELGDARILSLLLRGGVDGNLDNPLFAAAENGRCRCVELLLEHGVVVDQVHRDCNTPLMIAASEGHLRVAQLLLEGGARCDLANRRGHTAMDLGVMTFNRDMVRLLARKTVQHLEEVMDI